MVICPGIANHSEKQYIRTFVDYAQKNGYRCAVLNHLGALPNIELTSPRMFTYGKLGPRPSAGPLISGPPAGVLLLVPSFSKFKTCIPLREMVGLTFVTAAINHVLGETTSHISLSDEHHNHPISSHLIGAETDYKLPGEGLAQGPPLVS